MEQNKQVKYDESNIKTLSSLEHIRLRSGMYIGRLGDGSNPNDGIYILLKFRSRLPKQCNGCSR